MTGLGALIVTTLLDSFNPGTPPMACDFPALQEAQEPLFVEVRARPSLKDQPGLYRARMDIDAKDLTVQLNAAAQPLKSPKSRGFLVSGKADETTHYVIGVDTKGMAALSITTLDQDPPLQMTRTGQCRNFSRLIRRWSPSTPETEKQ